MGSLEKNIKEEGHADQQRYSFAMEAAKKEGSGIKILELGCDDGSFAYGFAQIGNKVTAIDLDCSKARDIHPHEDIEYLNENVENINYHEEYDVVHAGEILEHVKNPKRLMELICRSVKKNGLIMISVPNFKHPQHLRTYSLRRFKKLLKKYKIEGSICIIRHNLLTKSAKTERYAIYNGRKKNEII